MNQQDDPVIDEVREVRRRISARVNHDPAKLVEYYMQLQEQYTGRLIDTSQSSDQAEQPAA